MNKSYFTIFLLACLFFNACNYVQKIRDGKTAFERKQYAVATQMLSAEYKKEKSRVEQGKIAYMLGESYTRMNQSEKAIEWYYTAYENQYGVDALKGYAYALKKNQQYTEASKAFKELGIEIGSPYEYRKEITACKIAQEWLDQANKSEYNIQSKDFNSKAADYAPSIYKDGQLVITSDRGSSTGSEKYNWTGNNFSDLFVVDPTSNKISPLDKGIINTVDNEGTVAFNSDFTEMYFSRCFSDDENGDNFCQLMVSKSDGNSWSAPLVLNFVEEEVNYAHPSLSKDGSTLYFSSNHPDGWGGYDLYVTERTPDGWDIPRLLSRSVNTIGDEMFPFIDNDTLYFASNQHTGMGGLDIYKSYKKEKDSWSPPFNLKAPINSGADDFGYVVDRSRAIEDKDIVQIGYFSSTRENGKGNDDIFEFKKGIPPPPPPPPPVDTTAPPPPPIVYKIILEGFVLEKIYSSPDDPNSKVLGRKPLGGSKVDVNFNDEKKSFNVGEDGQFTMELEENTDYYFFGSKPNYLNNNARFSTRGIAKDPANPIQKYEVEIVLDKIFKNKEIVLDNIYYDYDKWDIRRDAEPTLNQLVTVLNQNPQIKIQLSSHTDCRGGANYNENLSQKRAQSAVDFLISKGIASNRLVAKGYGKNALAIECICSRCTEAEHQANRRTTFKILE